MCDYSLMGVPNRLGAEHEDLVAHRFPAGSMGLASPLEVMRLERPAPRPWGIRAAAAAVREFFNPPVREQVAAVCIPPGARLWLRDIPERVQSELGVGPEQSVVFTQTGAAVNTYRDAVRFSNGRVMLLQELREGQRVRVLDLSLAETAAPFLEDREAFSGWSAALYGAR